MLPAAVRELLTGPLADVRRFHEADLARGFGRVVLPFVFSAGRLCRDPRHGPPSRYHVHPSVV
jgi:hypothetical protein